jgi:hypothetical protein
LKLQKKTAAEIKATGEKEAAHLQSKVVQKHQQLGKPQRIRLKLFLLEQQTLCVLRDIIFGKTDAEWKRCLVLFWQSLMAKKSLLKLLVKLLPTNQRVV